MSATLISQLPLNPHLQKKLLEIAQKNSALSVWGPLGTEKESLVFTWYQMKHHISIPLKTIVCHEAFSTLPALNQEQVYYFQNIEMLPLTLQEQLAAQLQKNPDLLNHVAISSFVPLKALTGPELFSKHLADFFTRSIEVPALIARSDEIPALLENLKNQINVLDGLNITGIHPEVLTVFSLHEWNGNTTELVAIFEGVCLRKKSGEIDVLDLPLALLAPHLQHLKLRSLQSLLSYAQS